MRGAGRVTAALLTVLLLAGCATPPARSLDEAVAGIPRARAPFPYRLAVAPIVVGQEAALGPKAPTASFWRPVDPSAERLQRAVVGAARASQGFSSVVDLGGSRAAELALPSAPSRSALASGGALDAAVRERADVLLSVRVTRSAARFAGHNDWYPWNVAGFFCVWPLLPYLAAGERYAADLTAVAELRAAGSEETLRTWTYRISSYGDLGDRDRGFLWLGVFSVPGSLEAVHYENAAELLMPYAEDELAVRLGRDLTQIADDRSSRPDVERRMAHAICLVIGAGRSGRREQGIRDLRVASDDAAWWRGFLADPARGRVPARNIVTLTEAEATRARILAALGECVERAGPRDDLIVYYSGYGFEGDGRAYLAPADFDAARPAESALSLSDLARVLARSRARTVCVLDTSFGGDAPPGIFTRTLVLPGRPGRADGERARAVEADLERLADGRAVIAASAPGAAAADLSPIRSDKLGLLTARLVDAASSPASDEDHDGWISVAEMFSAARRDAVNFSGDLGLLHQEPRLFARGVDPRSMRIARVRQ